MTVVPGTGADGNGNGVIDAADYTVWLDNLGATTSGFATLAVVPEPSTMGLLLVLLGSLMAVRCRQQLAQH